MSNRGNQDYFKVSGSPTAQPDQARMAHQSLAAEQAKQRRDLKGPPVAADQAVPIPIHAKPKHHRKLRVKPSTAAGQGTLGPIGEIHVLDSEPHSPGRFHVPSFGEAARMAFTGAWKLGGWAASITLEHGGRAIVRRVESLLGIDRGKEDHAPIGEPSPSKP